jgi:hypothetical protein
VSRTPAPTPCASLPTRCAKASIALHGRAKAPSS